MKNSRFLIPVLLLIVLCGSIGAKPKVSVADNSDEACYPVKVEIINKAKLPPERLAEALYAKWLLTRYAGNSDWMLKQASKLVPTDPVYIFLQISNVNTIELPTPTADISGLSEEELLIAEKKLDQQRLDHNLLDDALSIDPNYLPALYEKAEQHPTVEEQMKAFDQIAQVDKDNARPYYLMAARKSRDISRDRLTSKEAKNEAVPVSDEEWESVIAFIRQGNSRAVVRENLPRVPSSRDIRVMINNKTMPPKAVDSWLKVNLEYGITDGTGRPRFASETNFSQLSQLYMQAKWKALELNRNGRRAEALAMLNTMSTFGENCAATEPCGFTNLFAGYVTHNNAKRTEATILQLHPNAARAISVQNSMKKWKSAFRACGSSMAKWYVTDKSVMVAPGKPLEYWDYKAEELAVRDCLIKLGVMK